MRGLAVASRPATGPGAPSQMPRQAGPSAPSQMPR
jgi:hypothetical protein